MYTSAQDGRGLVRFESSALKKKSAPVRTDRCAKRENTFYPLEDQREQSNVADPTTSPLVFSANEIIA